jgi:predicted DCC family thiol-disulfide oxidoreductase YuxK
MEDEKILLFDGVCVMCNKLVNFLINRDKKEEFKFAQLQSEAIQSLLGDHKLPPFEFNPFMYLRDGRLYFKSTAILHVFRDLGGVWQILFGFIIIPGTIRDFFYDILARRRYKLLGKLDACPIPPKDIRERFIL